MIPKSGPSPEDEQELDAILANIDRLLDHQCKKATAHHNGEKADTPPSTVALSQARFKKTQMAFQALSESKLMLDESGSDLSTINDQDQDEVQAEPAPRKSIWPWKRAALG